VVAILGPSGSGKSTLIRLINQLETLNGGEILIDNKPTGQLSGAALRQLRSRVGFVFQQFNLYAHLTASQNITLALEHVHGWKPQPAQERALALLENVGMLEKAHHFPPSFPAASSSAWRLPAPWPLHRKSSCSMNPPPRSIRR
jgi:polar amino acid transport system ATP-binding protein